MSHEIYFTLSVLGLAALLFWPVSKLIWVLSVRRLERKRQVRLSDEERAAQRTRARVIAACVVLVFSFLFNAQSVGIP